MRHTENTSRWPTPSYAVDLNKNQATFTHDRVEYVVRIKTRGPDVHVVILSCAATPLRALRTIVPNRRPGWDKAVQWAFNQIR